MSIYFGEPDTPTQFRRWLNTARHWLEGEDTIGGVLPDPHTTRDIVAAIEATWKGGWHLFAREQRRREGEAI